MKRGYKLCPYCANNIREWAIKCQYCWEFLDKEERTRISKSNNLSPSRWRRILAYWLDFILTYTIIWGIINICYVLGSKRTPLWNMVTWIKCVDKQWNNISWRQSVVRFFVFYPMLLFVTFSALMICLLIVLCVAWIFNHYIDSEALAFDAGFIRGRIMVYPAIISLILNLIEIFYSCPTFIDWWIWMNRVKHHK